MLGYVRAYKPELKFKEYDVYKGIYCSLCKTLLHRYSPLGQLFLSYDATFLALLLMSVSDTCPTMTKSRCCYNPTKTCYSCKGREELAFCADVSVILFYYKILDDLHDHGFLHRVLAAILFPAAFFMHRKASRLQPKAEAILSQAMARQAEYEQDETCSLDRAADPSASALEGLAGLWSENPDFARLFYLLGRYVYIIDAVDDVPKDIKSGNFNPLKSAYFAHKEEFSEYAMEILNLTMSEMLTAYDHIPFKQYKSIVYNVIFDGLYNSAVLVKNRHKSTSRQEAKR